MEKNQYDICIEVLRRLDKVGILNYIVLIGSWCIPFYKKYFASTKYVSSIRTRDIDLLVQIHPKFKNKIDIPNLFKDLGFVIDFRGSKGYIKLVHPELIVEFMVPDKGRGLGKPYPLPQLGLNAQPLRFLNLLTQHTINIKIEDISVTLPHPINFALQKLIISSRRKIEEKAIKDRISAIRLLKSLIDKGESGNINKTFNSIPRKWQRYISQALEEEKEYDILDVLK